MQASINDSSLQTQQSEMEYPRMVVPEGEETVLCSCILALTARFLWCSAKFNRREVFTYKHMSS